MARVDCLWLLPFTPRAARRGYDIRTSSPCTSRLRTVGDAAELIDGGPPARGIRVIADMVMNHTSDQHPWFQESRQSRTNPKHDWYVWNDDNERWSEARIIFVDTELITGAGAPARAVLLATGSSSHQPDL
ncbi:MAG: alpha-amylase family glycosyl hydrolase [Acidimicrobiales bacterium]